MGNFRREKGLTALGNLPARGLAPIYTPRYFLEMCTAFGTVYMDMGICMGMEMDIDRDAYTGTGTDTDSDINVACIVDEVTLSVDSVFEVYKTGFSI